MGKFVFLYTGGAMAETPEAQKAAMDAWMGWFGTLGDDIVDHGNPFGASSTVKADGSSEDGAAGGISGYTVISANSLSDAAGKAKGCPVLSSGGTVEVYEAIPM
ncbi:MAG TPA: hypothetical protein VN768_01925 [Acidimicrobiales bacterium]|nr:hypothetical protein [Acidimicrobiales bacterium]